MLKRGEGAKIVLKVMEFRQEPGDEGPVSVQASFDFATDLYEGTPKVCLEVRVEDEEFRERLVDIDALALHALNVRFDNVAT